jgi:hypothetical protein
MSILRLKSSDYAILKSYEPSSLEDVAYQRKEGVRSFCLTPYKLLEMYGLRQNYDYSDSSIKRIAQSVGESPYVYVADLGDVTTIGNSISSLENIVKSASYPESWKDYMDQIYKYFEEGEIISQGGQWFGYPLPQYLDYVTGTKRVYPKLKEANQFFDKFESELRINPETDVPKPRTFFTSRPTGIFTFSRVAPTLYAFPCYKIDESDESCIPPSNIVRRDGRFYLGDAPDVEVGVYGYERREDGSEKFRTLAKRVYATKQNKIVVTPYINIYVNVVAGSDTKALSYRYNSFAAVALAKLLTANGFKVSITTVFFAYSQDEVAAHKFPYDQKDHLGSIVNKGFSMKNSCIYISKFNVKSYSELLDFNTALIYGGDPAFFRYEMFAAHINNAYAWYRKLPRNYGSVITTESDIDDILERYNIYTTKNETRIVISGRFSLNSAMDAVRTKLSQLKLLYGGRS